VPDHVQFVHEPHIRYFTQGAGRAEAVAVARAKGLTASDSPSETEVMEATCSICHGKIRDMEKVKQTRSLKMGDCVDCHRAEGKDAPTDCVTCHY
jgi:tRNA U54 and U55 pseudouridine synthase Pus10